MLDVAALGDVVPAGDRQAGDFLENLGALTGLKFCFALRSLCDVHVPLPGPTDTPVTGLKLKAGCNGSLGVTPVTSMMPPLARTLNVFVGLAQKSPFSLLAESPGEKTC